MLRFLRVALAGEKVDVDLPTLAVHGFRLARPPATPPPILLGALRPGMLRLAGREADGAVINWLSADDVATVAAEVGPGKEIVARIFVIPTPDAELARNIGRRMIAAYLNVPVYAEFHRWLGRGPLLEPMWQAWAAGDRKGALAAMPDEVVDDLIVHGEPDACRAHVDRYVANGVTVPALMVVAARASTWRPPLTPWPRPPEPADGLPPDLGRRAGPTGAGQGARRPGGDRGGPGPHRRPRPRDRRLHRGRRRAGPRSGVGRRPDRGHRGRPRPPGRRTPRREGPRGRRRLPHHPGSTVTEGAPAALADSALVARLRAAGCVVVGKTNTPGIRMGGHDGQRPLRGRR